MNYRIDNLWPHLKKAALRTNYPFDGSHGRHLFYIVLSIGAALWFVSFLFVSTVPLLGDEIFYARAASSIGKFIAGEHTFLQMRSAVVGNGWFTPGIPLILTPVYIIEPTPNYVVLRLYASILTFSLWAWTLREVYRIFGRGYAAALLVFPALDLSWLFFSAAIWGDLPAGLLLVAILGRTWELARRAIKGAPIKFRQVLLLEVLLVLAFYLRGNSILVVVAVHFFLFAVLVIGGKWRLLPRRMCALATGVFLCTAGLAPWSIFASRALGDTIISTSTAALSFGITFGNRSELCFGPCPSDNIWLGAAAFSRDYAAEHGISVLATQMQMAANATRNLTIVHYAAQVRENFQRLLFRPAGFTQDKFLPNSTLGFSRQTVDLLGWIGALWTGALYFPFLLALALANGFVVIKGRREQLESLCLKMFTLCLLVQPFVHPGHSRYWPVFAPLMAISGAFLIKMATKDRREHEPGSAALVAIQGLYVMLVLATGVTLLLAG